jgi:ferric-chelate reductase
MHTDMPAMGTMALNDTGVDFSNETQAMDILAQILDDTEFQVDGNAFARYFWYGIVVVIGIAAIFNIIQRNVLRMRYFLLQMLWPRRY